MNFVKHSSKIKGSSFQLQRIKIGTFPSLNTKQSWDILTQPRLLYSLLVQFETGHNYMARHQHFIDRKFDPASQPTCTLCGKDQETSAHILAQCEELEHAHMRHFGQKWLSPPYNKLKTNKILGFLKEVPLEGIEFFFGILENQDILEHRDAF